MGEVIDLFTRKHLEIATNVARVMIFNGQWGGVLESHTRAAEQAVLDIEGLMPWSFEDPFQARSFLMGNMHISAVVTSLDWVRTERARPGVFAGMQLVHQARKLAIPVAMFDDHEMSSAATIGDQSIRLLPADADLLKPELTNWLKTAINL